VYDVGIMGNGALAGLVAITSGTSTVYPWAAVIIGLVAGALYCAGSRTSIALHVSRILPSVAPRQRPTIRGRPRQPATLQLCRALMRKWPHGAALQHARQWE
jgi:hypothetical protein